MNESIYYVYSTSCRVGRQPHCCRWWHWASGRPSNSSKVYTASEWQSLDSNNPRGGTFRWYSSHYTSYWFQPRWCPTGSWCPLLSKYTVSSPRTLCCFLIFYLVFGPDWFSQACWVFVASWGWRLSAQPQDTSWLTTVSCLCVCVCVYVHMEAIIFIFSHFQLL